ncbi:MAG: hypothetical protein ABIQ11_07540, partial [Saprospiraceae bacterium]
FLTIVRTVLTGINDYDAEVVEIKSVEDQILRFVYQDLKPRAEGIKPVIESIIKKVDDALKDITTFDAFKQTQQVELAAKAIFGGEFKIVTSFSLAAQQAFELDNAWNDSSFLDYLKNDHPKPFEYPVEDWLHGVARVREKMHHVENVVLLREALDLNENEFDLHPVQLPYSAGSYHWMAMPFPKNLNLEENDFLLYTALTSSVANTPGSASGFLIDEWTEVIPSEKEMTGLSFHYDRPNSEAPQTMLLVTPSKLTGMWEWQDIIDSMHFALDSARIRAVEPYHVDDSDYGRYLPALVSPVTRHPITIGMYLTELSLTAIEQ